LHFAGVSGAPALDLAVVVELIVRVANVSELSAVLEFLASAAANNVRPADTWRSRRW
jgi:hypothetical protein